MKKEFNENVKS